MTSYDLIWLLIQEILKDNSSENNQKTMKNRLQSLFWSSLISCSFYILGKFSELPSI